MKVVCLTTFLFQNQTSLMIVVLLHILHQVLINGGPNYKINGTLVVVKKLLSSSFNTTAVASTTNKTTSSRASTNNNNGAISAIVTPAKLSI